MENQDMKKPLTFQKYSNIVGGLISDLPELDINVSNIPWKRPHKDTWKNPFSKKARHDDPFAFAFVGDKEGRVFDSCAEAFQAIQEHGSFITGRYRITLSLNEKYLNRTLVRKRGGKKNDTS